MCTDVVTYVVAAQLTYHGIRLRQNCILFFWVRFHGPYSYRLRQTLFLNLPGLLMDTWLPGDYRTKEEINRTVQSVCTRWPAPGSADTELGVLMEPEVCHGETEVYT